MEVNQQSRETALFGGTISLVALATIAVALRMYARSITKARYWWDDWVLILALVNIQILPQRRRSRRKIV